MEVVGGDSDGGVENIVTGLHGRVLTRYYNNYCNTKRMLIIKIKL